MNAAPPGPSAPTRDRRAVGALRMVYFAAFGGLGALAPFLALLLERRGLTPTQIGIALVVVPIVGLVVPPVWGLVADGLRARLWLLRLACLGSAAGSAALIPSWGLPGSVAALVLFSFFRSPLTPLADAAAVDALGGESRSFATIRIWGSVGFALVAYLVGRLGGSARPTAMLATAACAYGVAALATAALQAPPPLRRRGVAGELRSFVRAPHVVLFLAGTTLHYLGHSTFDAYFGLLARRMGHGDGVVGAAWGLGVLVEVGVMWLGPRLLPAARAARWLALCSAAAAVRWMALTFVSAAGPVVAVQALHGLTFGLWYLALVAFIQSRAPGHLRTSLQSAAFACIGLGQVVGYLGGGRLLGALGAVALYRAAGLAALLATGCYLVSASLRPAGAPETNGP